MYSSPSAVAEQHIQEMREILAQSIPFYEKRLLSPKQRAALEIVCDEAHELACRLSTLHHVKKGAKLDASYLGQFSESIENMAARLESIAHAAHYALNSDVGDAETLNLIRERLHASER
jgi:hypothetical protein